MKNLFVILLMFLAIACQREVQNQVGMGYNKTLIVPPTNDLPLPGSSEINNNFEIIDNTIVNSILDKTQAKDVDPAIIDKIDGDSGYNTDENLFQKLFKGKSKR